MRAAFILMTMLATSAGADDQTEITFHAGRLSLNTGRATAAGGSVSGSTYGLRYLHSATAMTSFGFDVDLMRPGQKTSTSLVPNASTESSLESASVLLVVRYGTTEEKIRPNFLFGMGAHFTSMQLESTPSAGFVWADTGTNETRSLMSSDGKALAIKLQGGADYAVNDNFVGGAYLAINHLGSTKYETTDRAKALGISNLSGAMLGVTIGVNFSGRF